MASLIEGAWSCYRGVHFNGTSLQKRSLYWSENGHTEVVLWKENGNFTEVLMVVLRGGHVTEVASLRKGEWSCCGGCHFNGGRKVMSEGQSWSV